MTKRLGKANPLRLEFKSREGLDKTQKFMVLVVLALQVQFKLF